MALDKVNNRLLIGHPGDGRYDIYNIGEDGLPVERHAVASIGAELSGKGFNTPAVNGADVSSTFAGDVDEVNQRLFMAERGWTGGPGGRIMVFDISPEYLDSLAPGELPEAIAVIGQPDSNTRNSGSGQDGIGGGGEPAVDDERQLLFFADGGNNRVLVYNIAPDNLESGMDAMAVIGQPDFNSTQPQEGAEGLMRPGDLAYDPEKQILFVSDAKKRVMVFDVSAQALDTNAHKTAFAVIGQTDFDSGAPRTSMRKFSSGGPIDLDYVNNRLFSATFTENRVLIFDVSPENLNGPSNPDAIAVLGQPSYEETDPAITQTRLTMTRITVDSERQLAYVPDGYPAGNNINIFDIHPDRMQEFLTPKLDQLGHVNPEGETDFLARAAHDVVSGKYWTQGRDVTVDTVDHRLFLNDFYGHRVLVFQLDRMNRLLDREAKWVIGQEDTETEVLLPGRSASYLKLPMAVEYDTSYKRLFVADTWNNRVLAFDMSPDQVESGMDATHVLGQENFESYEVATAADRISFGTRNGRGIGPSGGRPAAMALDKINQRLFVADGENNRVLVFDMHPDRIESGSDAIGVIGQTDFTSNEPGQTGAKFSLPGDMVMDDENQRLFVELPFQDRILVFNVAPGTFENGMAASYVIGQPDFTTRNPGLSSSGIRQPDGISYDPVQSHLYVTDKFNNRILTFDVAPERMTNMPEAIGVIGEGDFDTASVGPGIFRDQQDVLFDPRGNFFDSVGRRLFQSEGTNGRLTVFTLPREEYDLDLPARSRLRYASTDAYNLLGSESLTEGYAVSSTDVASKLVSVNTHYITREYSQGGTRRQSRELESVAMLPVTDAVTTASYYVETSDDSDVLFSFINDTNAAAAIEFSLTTENGQQLEASRTILASNQLALNVSELFSGNAVQGSLSISSSQPVHIQGLFEVGNGEGETLLAPAPGVQGSPEYSEVMAERRILPAIPTGAGSYVKVVLLNASENVMSGTIEVTDQDDVFYEIAPGQSIVHNIPPDARPPLEGKGIIRAEVGPAPEAFALVAALTRSGAMSSLHTVTSHQEGPLFWAPLDTYPDVLHNGNIDTSLYLVNDKNIPATVYLEWFDIDGNSVDIFERTIVRGESAILNIEEIYGQNPVRGTLRVFSDTGINATLQESTRTVLGETVVMDIPLQVTPDASASRKVFPLFRNGGGYATEMLSINTDRSNHGGSLSVVSSDGDAIEIILR